MKKYRERLLDAFSSVLHAVVSFVAASLVTTAVFNVLIRDFLEGVWKWERQTTYNVMLLVALLVAGVIYATVILRFHRFEVQDALKTGKSIRNIVQKQFFLQNLTFLAVFSVCSLVLTAIGVQEEFWVGADPRSGVNIFSTGCECFFGWKGFIAVCGAFVPIIPQGWLAWICNVAAYAALLWGGTWWFVYRTDRKLLGKKKK